MCAGKRRQERRSVCKEAVETEERGSAWEGGREGGRKGKGGIYHQKGESDEF